MINSAKFVASSAATEPKSFAIVPDYARLESRKADGPTAQGNGRAGNRVSIATSCDRQFQMIEANTGDRHEGKHSGQRDSPENKSD